MPKLSDSHSLKDEDDITLDKILKILNDLKEKSYQVNNRITVLSSYAEYRHMYGDCRLKMMLRTSDRINRLSRKTTKSFVYCENMNSIYVIARELAKSGDKTGVWMGLLLFGIRTTEFQIAKTRKKKKSDGETDYFIYIYRTIKNTFHLYEVRVPKWLYLSVQKFRPEDLQRSTQQIGDILRRYGTNIQNIYNLCNHYEFDFDKFEQNGTWRRTDSGSGKPKERGKKSK